MQLTTCATQMLRLACSFRLSFILPPSSFATSGCGMSNLDGRTLSGCLRFCGNPQRCWGMVPARHAFWAASLWDPGSLSRLPAGHVSIRHGPNRSNRGSHTCNTVSISPRASCTSVSSRKYASPKKSWNPVLDSFFVAIRFEDLYRIFFLDGLRI